jgi:hypothetical protein
MRCQSCIIGGILGLLLGGVAFATVLTLSLQTTTTTTTKTIHDSQGEVLVLASSALSITHIIPSS